jgi:hypothetical protein
MPAFTCRAVIQALLHPALLKENPMTFVTTQPDMVAAAAMHDLFVSALGGSADSYGATEAANATSSI